MILWFIGFFFEGEVKMDKIIAYKGFNEKMQCQNNYQFAEGETYVTEGKVEICQNGFHACDNPLDIFKYYRPDGRNKFHVVEYGGVIDRKTDEDSKFACEKLKVGAEVNLATMIKIGFEAIFKRVKDVKPTASGDYSTGAASGDYSTGAASGNCSTGAASGDCSTGAASGNYSTGVATGKYGIAVANGYGARAKGALGNYLVLTEYDGNGILLFCKMHKVDGKTVKPDTLYTLQGGKFTEVK